MSAQNWKKLVGLAVVMVSFSTLARRDAYPEAPADDPRTQQLRQIYPFRPLATDELHGRVNRMTEDPAALKNIFEITSRGLTTARARQQPWAGSFWPLIQGQIGNSYHDKSFFDPEALLSWKENVRDFKKKREEKLARPYELSEKELRKLAPSEKYDLLLGDTNFDLTNRIWNFVENYGNQKQWAFLSSIDMPLGFRLPVPNDKMALWEGICHGWALAAGGSERPLETVEFTLPNGKKLPFLPTDIKALISLMYANSVVQDNVLMEGLRCDNPNPKQDQFGRFIDTVPVARSEEVLPRCADVHPAVWFLSVVNLTGIQGRALVVEVDAHATVNNHPFAGYDLKYFNPDTGREGPLERSILAVDQFRRPDVYAASRNPQTRSIVGVEMKIVYTNWTWPKEGASDDQSKDPMKKKTMLFDLELDAQGNVIGGQWRADKDPRNFNKEGDAAKTNQPDFFWTLPKNYQSYFQNNPSLPNWNPAYQQTPPAAWGDAAKSAHMFTYNVTREYGFNEKCTVINDATRETREVPCEFQHPKPQPLINLVNKLLEMSRRPVAP